MTISFVGTTVKTSPSGGTHDVAVPSGVVNGDYMVVVLSSGNSNTITPPAGWTEIISQNTISLRLFVYGRVANNEPTSHAWGTADNISIVCGAWHSSTGPLALDSTIQSVVNIQYASSITVSCAAQNNAGTLILVGAFDTSAGTAGSWVAPSGFAKRIDYKGVVRPNMTLMDLLSSPASISTSRIASWTGTSAGTTMMPVAIYEVNGTGLSSLSIGLFFGTNF